MAYLALCRVADSEFYASYQLKMLLQAVIQPPMIRQFLIDINANALRARAPLSELKPSHLPSSTRFDLRKQIQHRDPSSLDDRNKEALKILTKPPNQIGLNEILVPADIDGDILAMLVDLEQETIIMCERHGQVLSVREDSRRRFPIVADDALGGHVAAGRVPVEDGLLGHVFDIGAFAQGPHGAVFEAGH